MSKRDRLISIARDWERIGVRWRHQGDSRAGADCLGFVAGVAYEAEIVDARSINRDSRFRGYGRDPDPSMLDEVLGTYCERVSIRDALAGDVLQLKWPQAMYPHHFAIVSELGDDGMPVRMIHSYAGEPRCVVEQGISRMMLERVRRVWRIRGID